jgi:hypothetical protein
MRFAFARFDNYIEEFICYGSEEGTGAYFRD